MKTLNKIKTIGLFLVFIGVMFVGCKKEIMPVNGTPVSGSSAAADSKIIPITGGALIIHLINTSPMARLYGEVNVQVSKVEALYENRDTWFPLTLTPKTFDLLHLQSANLVEYTRVPAGNIVKIRLFFGSRNNVVTFNGISRALSPLAVPVDHADVNVIAMVRPGMPTAITVDFKANASISNEGNGIYILSPIISQSKTIIVNPESPTSGAQ